MAVLFVLIYHRFDLMSFFFLYRADESNADTKRHVNFVNYDTLDDVKEEQKDLDGSKCRYIAEQHARACLTPDEGLLQVLKRKE